MYDRLGKILLLLLLLPGFGLAACKWPSAPPAGDQCSEIAIPTATINVDGDPGDWIGIPPQLNRSPGAPESTGAYQLEQLYVAADHDRLYLRIDASEHSPLVADAGAPGDAGGPTCGDGKCEGTEDQYSCPDDCGDGPRPEFRITVKTTDFRACDVSVGRSGSSPDDPWRFDGYWQSDEHDNSTEAAGDAKVKSLPGQGMVVEIWLERKDFGSIFSVHPTWARCCENNQGPTIEDEIGCVWASLSAGPQGDASSGDGPDAMPAGCDGGVLCGGLCCPAGQTCSDAGQCQTPGQPWQQTKVPGVVVLNAIWGSSPSDIWAVGGGSSGGAVFHYAGAPAGWSPVSTPPVGDLYDIWGVPPDVWAVGAVGEILHFDGSTWTRDSSGVSELLRGVWASSATNVWVVGENGTVLSNAGSGWGTYPTGTFNHLYAVWGTPDGAWGWIVGAQTILRWTGSGWYDTSPGWMETLFGLHGLSGSEIWAVGTNGALRRGDGTGWNSVTTGTSETLSAVWASSSDFGWAVGSGGTILRFEGTSASAELSGTTANLWGVWASSATDVWAVGDGGLILHRP